MDEECIVIKVVDNGFVVENHFYHDDAKDGSKIIRKHVEVIEEENGEDGEKNSLAGLLYKVAELTGYTYDRYGEENLSISFNKKGGKVS